MAQLHADLQHAPVCHVDETRHQSHNQPLWMWALVIDWGVRFRIDVLRDQMAARLLLGHKLSFITVIDRYAGYNHLPLEQRQVCWAHLLRDFERIAGRAALAGLDGRRLLGYGYLLFRWRDQGKDVRHYDWLQKRIRAQQEVGSQQKVCSRTSNSCTNLVNIWPALWTFVDNPLVPLTNNAAERALRDYVINRKLSYCTRSGRGLQFTERFFLTVQTCKMQWRVAIEYIGNIVQSWLGGIRAPSLVPEHIHLRHAYG